MHKSVMNRIIERESMRNGFDLNLANFEAEMMMQWCWLCWVQPFVMRFAMCADIAGLLGNELARDLSWLRLRL